MKDLIIKGRAVSEITISGKIENDLLKINLDDEYGCTEMDIDINDAKLIIEHLQKVYKLKP